MSASRPPEIPEGTPTIGRGRFFVVNRLGEGGLSGVYRAWDSRLRVWRAVKILFPQYSNNEQVRRRFGAEAHAMARLVHDNLVRIYDVDEDGALPFLVMELVDGGTLHDWVLRYGPMAPRQATAVVQQVASGVGAAHEAGIIHRDVKPQNVLIAKTGMCKLTDFGIARQLDHEHSLEGVPLGTRGYMAPEQYSNAANVDSRADIFGLGATLWTLLTGRLPPDVFDVNGRPELLEMVPKPLRPVIRVCCAIQPPERLKRADSLERALATARAQLPPDPPDTVMISAQLLEPPEISAWIDFPEIRPVLERPGQTVTPITGTEDTIAPVETDEPDVAPEAPEAPPAPLPREGPTTGESRVLPYSMPDVQGKATPLRERSRADDRIPDYIDRADLARTSQERTLSAATPAGLDVKVRANEVIASTGTIPPVDRAPPPSLPGGVPSIVPSHTPAPPRTSATPIPQARTPAPYTPAPASYAPSAPPRRSRAPDNSTTILLVGASAVALLGLLLLLGVVLASNSLASAQAAVAESRTRVYVAMRDLGPMITELPAEERDRLASVYLDYNEHRNAGETARINAAMRLLDEFERAVPVAVSAAEPAAVWSTRARRLKAIRGHYQADLQAWRAKSTAFPGSLLLSLGMASTPPEARAWR